MKKPKPNIKNPKLKINKTINESEMLYLNPEKTLKNKTLNKNFR
jgi:hypothetical protein